MWRVIHIETTGENVFLETESEYLAKDTYKCAVAAVKNKAKGGLGMLGARLECDSDLTGNYEIVDEISVEDFNAEYSTGIVKESSLYNINENKVVASVISKILEGADVRSTVLEYVPDITQRYPEGMNDLPDDSEDPDFEPVLVKDVIKSIEADVAYGEFYNHINVWKNNKKIADLHNVSDLEKFKNDFVHNWCWFDATIDVYLV